MAQLAAAAPNEPGKIYVSNHSYGALSGWSSDPIRWYGTFSNDGNPSNDYPNKFGRYRATTRSWDGLVWNAPYFLPFKSAGNDRNDFGPGPGGGHYVWDNDLGDWAWSTVTRDPDGGADGFDCISYHGNAKNILTVGAVQDLPAIGAVCKEAGVPLEEDVIESRNVSSTWFSPAATRSSILRMRMLIEAVSRMSGIAIARPQAVVISATLALWPDRPGSVFGGRQPRINFGIGVSNHGGGVGVGVGF